MNAHPCHILASSSANAHCISKSNGGPDVVQEERLEAISHVEARKILLLFKPAATYSIIHSAR